MNTSSIVSSTLRFVVLLLLQVFLLQQVSWGWGGREYLLIFIYPLFVAFLPLTTPRPLVILLGFLLGLGIDFFYETLGLHAAALTFTGFFRQIALTILEPRDGYKLKATASRQDLGLSWQLYYVGLLLTAHCVFFFAVQSFSPVFWRDILLKVLFTLPVSFIVCGIFVLIFNPRT